MFPCALASLSLSSPVRFSVRTERLSATGRVAVTVGRHRSRVRFPPPPYSPQIAGFRSERFPGAILLVLGLERAKRGQLTHVVSEVSRAVYQPAPAHNVRGEPGDNLVLRQDWARLFGGERPGSRASAQPRTKGGTLPAAPTIGVDDSIGRKRCREVSAEWRKKEHGQGRETTRTGRCGPA
jgi:hypothetical protein